MRLNELVQVLEAPEIVGDSEVEITGIQSDSRLVVPGSLFVAVRGTAVDGHTYIGAAIEKGAAAVVCEEIPENLNGKTTFVVVKDSAPAVGPPRVCVVRLSLAETGVGRRYRHEWQDDYRYLII